MMTVIVVTGAESLRVTEKTVLGCMYMRELIASMKGGLFIIKGTLKEEKRVLLFLLPHQLEGRSRLLCPLVAKKSRLLRCRSV